jgi:hypothetical protein
VERLNAFGEAALNQTPILKSLYESFVGDSLTASIRNVLFGILRQVLFSRGYLTVRTFKNLKLIQRRKKLMKNLETII